MKLIEAKQAKEFASTFLADKILQAAVNAVVDNAPGFELVRCKECKHEKNCLMCIDLIGETPITTSSRHIEFCSFGERRTDG